jgi:hypothetical protein
MLQDLLADEENQSRRTFCQMSFMSIYDNAEKGQRSVENLLQFMQRKNEAEHKYIHAMLHLVNEVHVASSDSATSTNGRLAELSGFEEPSTSLKRALTQWQHYWQRLYGQQLMWSQVVEEHVVQPLSSLQEASMRYVQTLHDEITRVNNEYTMAEAMQRKVDSNMHTMMLFSLSSSSSSSSLSYNRHIPSFHSFSSSRHD